MQGPAWQGAEAAAEAFQARLAATGRRPVLLVDNLDFVLDALPDSERWMLRWYLQALDGPVLYGAAVCTPRQCGDRDEAFYEFFRLHVLESLSAQELLACLHRLAEIQGEAGKPVLSVLSREPQRVRVLHTLSGGNPRILSFISERLIEWFEQTGHSERHAPVYAAFVALVRGERTLLDINPDVRQTAENFYRWLARRKQANASPPEPAPSAKRRRGRPSKRSSGA
jgi:hypothetical protein